MRQRDSRGLKSSAGRQEGSEWVLHAKQKSAETAKIHFLDPLRCRRPRARGGVCVCVCVNYEPFDSQIFFLHFFVIISVGPAVAFTFFVCFS